LFTTRKSWKLAVLSVDQLGAWDGKGKIDWPFDSDAFSHDSVLHKYESSGIDNSEVNKLLDALSSSPMRGGFT